MAVLVNNFPGRAPWLAACAVFIAASQAPAAPSFQDAAAAGPSFRLAGDKTWVMSMVAARTDPRWSEWTWFPRMKVLSVLKDGVLLVDSPLFDSSALKHRVVFVANLPEAAKLVDDAIVRNFVALKVGTYRYQAAGGSLNTVEKFDHGTSAKPPLWLSQQMVQDAERKAATAQLSKQRSSAAALAWHLTQASNGLPSAQCSLGKRYLTGDGVPIDTNLARIWLQKSAAQGDVEARLALEKLPSP